MANEHEKRYITLTKVMKEAKVQILRTDWTKDRQLLLCVSQEHEKMAKEVLAKREDGADLLPILVFKPASIADGCIRVESRQGAMNVNLATGESWPCPSIFSFAKGADALP